MPTLDSSDILNAPIGDALVSVPLGGIYILKQLLSQYISWDTQDPQELDTLDSILAQTIALREAQPVTRLVSIVNASANQTITAGTAVNLNTWRGGDTVVSFLPGGVLQMVYSGIYQFDLGLRFQPQTAGQALTAYATGLNGFTPRGWLYTETALQYNTVRYTATQHLEAGHQVTFFAAATNALLLASTSGLIINVETD